MKVQVQITFPNGSIRLREADIDSATEWAPSNLFNTQLIQDAYMRPRMWEWGADQAEDIDDTTAWMRGPTWEYQPHYEEIGDALA